MGLLKIIESGKLVLLDGAMGTQLGLRGLMGGGRVNLDAPEAVVDIHRAYAGCGCTALLTNTLTMNRIYVETHDVGVDVAEVNRAGVDLARRGGGDGVWVLGDMGSTGQMLEPFGTFTREQLYETFAEQAGLLADAGVDGFLIETMFDLNEAVCAVRACEDSFALPIIVSMAFATDDHGGRTVMGNSAQQCAEQLTEAGADAVGANCGDLDPAAMAAVVKKLRSATDLPIVVQPNAGRPHLIKGQTVYDMSPHDFAHGVAKCIEAGATLIGGCCGTSPEHIRAVAELVGPVARRGASV